MNPLDPTDEYVVPKRDSRYLKFEKGETTKFLPLSSAISGYEYWTTDKKPVRLREVPKVAWSKLPDIKMEDDGTYKVVHFWFFPVIDCSDGKVKILEITQVTIQRAIQSYVHNEDWGSPILKYSFSVNREGEGKGGTTYTTMANPTKEIPEEWLFAWNEAKEAGFDINRLFSNGDPFTPDLQ